MQEGRHTGGQACKRHAKGHAWRRAGKVVRRNSRAGIGWSADRPEGRQGSALEQQSRYRLECRRDRRSGMQVGRQGSAQEHQDRYRL